MAVFTENSDLSRQDQSLYREGLKGNKKLIMNALGYNKHGERSKWGKVMPFLSFGGDVGSRLIANKVAKGTSAEETMKATNQEYWAAKGSQLKFTVESAKLAAQVAGAGAGAGGGAAGASGLAGIGGKSGSAAASALGGSPTSLATPPISGSGLDPSALGSGNDFTSVLSGGKNIGSMGDVSSVMSGNPDVTAGLNPSGVASTDVPDIGGDPVEKALNSDIGQDIQDMKSNSDVKDTEDLLKEEIEKKAKEEKSQSDKLDENIQKGIDVADKAMPIIGAGAEWYQNARAQDKEEDRIKKKQLSRTVMADYNLL